MELEIRRLGYDDIVNNYFEQYKAYDHAFFKDIYPDDNPNSDEMIKENISEKNNECFRFSAFNQGRIVGSISTWKLRPEHPEYSQKKHISMILGSVLPEYRRQGIARKLARLALGMAYQNGVEVVKSYTYCEGGRRFSESLGGEVVSADSDRTLELKNLDWSMIDNWLKIPVGNLKLEYCPEMSEEFINRTIDISYASTFETRMMDNCEVPPTKEGEIHSLREYSQFLKNTSKSYHCLLLIEPTGDIIGFTEGTISQENQDIFDQGMTMVWKHHRGHGYGKYLKASMLDYVRKNHPQITKISTGNNDLNAPMLAINIKLGFESVRQIKVYRIDVRKALDNLKM